MPGRPPAGSRPGRKPRRLGVGAGPPVAARWSPTRDLDPPAAPEPDGGSWPNRVCATGATTSPGLLACGRPRPRGLPRHVHRLALTDGQVTDVLAAWSNAAVAGRGGYVRLAGRPAGGRPKGDVGFSLADPDPTPGRGARGGRWPTSFSSPAESSTPSDGVSTTDHDPWREPASTSGRSNRRQRDLALVDIRVPRRRGRSRRGGLRSQAAFDALGRRSGSRCSARGRADR